jgi:hypothetical protein
MSETAASWCAPTDGRDVCADPSSDASGRAARNAPRTLHALERARSWREQVDVEVAILIEHAHILDAGSSGHIDDS